MIYQELTPATLLNKKEIYRFDNGKYLTYFRFKFDDFCVALIDENSVDVPLDREYFATLKELARKFGKRRTWLLFLRVYALVKKGMTTPNEAHWAIIKKWSREFVGKHDEYFEVTFETMCILYIAMISEENHLYNGYPPPLGKDVKKIGVYQVLIEDFSPSAAANFTKGMRWRDMNEISMKHNEIMKVHPKIRRVNGFAR